VLSHVSRFSSPVARSATIVLAPALDVPSRDDRIGHALSGLFHPSVLRVSGCIGVGFDTAHLGYTDDYQSFLQVMRVISRASGLCGPMPISRYHASVSRAPSSNGVGTNPRSCSAFSLETCQS
jgi:hypothetical protein